jgi:D-alanyl-D-alanine dipeptidase
MLRKIVLLILLTVPFAALAQEKQNPWAQSRQAVLVVTKDWAAVDGTMQRFELKNQKWQPLASPIRVVVGRKGLGWGRGLHVLKTLSDPSKKEGDGKSPAGIFRLSSAFGYATPAEMKAIKLPYVQCTPSLECVDDPQSIYYNTVLDRAKFKSTDWKSSEQMLMKDNDQYRLGIVVDHNQDPLVSNQGSCIFMHIWKAPGNGTSGCTAMTPSDMETLIRWLDPAAKPVLVQLPQAEYLRLQKEWQLPMIHPANPPTVGGPK